MLKYPELALRYHKNICLVYVNVKRKQDMQHSDFHIYFIVIVVSAWQILAHLGKVARKQSRVLLIHDIQKCTIAWWFETKENYNTKITNHISENLPEIFSSDINSRVVTFRVKEVAIFCVKKLLQSEIKKLLQNAWKIVAIQVNITFCVKSCYI